ncbi:MAG: hypothetical protein Q8P97_00035, partial [bacterium]|nr:hypothetical protein [bacterium]
SRSYYIIMWRILRNKKSLTFLGVAILILTALLALIFNSFGFLLSAALGSISNPSEATTTVEHFNLLKTP